MILRTFVFRVSKRKQRAMVAFMRREARRLVKRIPACRRAYFARNLNRTNEYLWVTVWTSEAARARAMRRKDWKQVVQQEEEKFFAGKPQVRHYRILTRK